jgi:hypothetical protein
MNLAEKVRFMIEDYENDVLMAERSGDAEPDPARAVTRIIGAMREAMLSRSAVEEGTKAVWNSSPGDWSFDRAKKDGSGFLAARIKQQSDFTAMAITAALDAVTGETQ